MWLGIFILMIIRDGRAMGWIPADIKGDDVMHSVEKGRLELKSRTSSFDQSNRSIVLQFCSGPCAQTTADRDTIELHFAYWFLDEGSSSAGFRGLKPIRIVYNSETVRVKRKLSLHPDDVQHGIEWAIEVKKGSYYVFCDSNKALHTFRERHPESADKDRFRFGASEKVTLYYRLRKATDLEPGQYIANQYHQVI